MAITVFRDDVRGRRHQRSALAVLTGPFGVLLASLALSVCFLVALSDLVVRLG
jgi:hypothetical protein